MAALSPRWRPLFATALYTGMRKGELLGLRKTDVDLDSGLLMVARSYGRDTTKGGHADVIPIAAELAPYLRGRDRCLALGADLSGPQGPDDVGAGEAPRRSVAGARSRRDRAGLLAPVPSEGVRAPGSGTRRGVAPLPRARPPPMACPTGPADPVPRPEAHDGQPAHDGRREPGRDAAHPAALGPEDHDRGLRAPAPGYQRAEVDHLAFGLPEVAPAEEPVRVVVGADPAPFAAPLLHEGSTGNDRAGTAPDSERSRPLHWRGVGDSNPWPPA